eukprot:453840-Pleurochrysis_carterae.AAC.2
MTVRRQGETQGRQHQPQRESRKQRTLKGNKLHRCTTRRLHSILGKIGAGVLRMNSRCQKQRATVQSEHIGRTEAMVLIGGSRQGATLSTGGAPPLSVTRSGISTASPVVAVVRRVEREAREDARQQRGDGALRCAQRQTAAACSANGNDEINGSQDKERC